MRAYRLLYEVESVFQYYDGKEWTNIELLAEVNRSVRGEHATMPQLCALIALLKETGEIQEGEGGWSTVATLEETL
jgi:hypothetical protein